MTHPRSCRGRSLHGIRWEVDALALHRDKRLALQLPRDPGSALSGCATLRDTHVVGCATFLWSRGSNGSTVKTPTGSGVLTVTSGQGTLKREGFTCYGPERAVWPGGTWPLLPRGGGVERGICPPDGDIPLRWSVPSTGLANASGSHVLQRHDVCTASRFKRELHAPTACRSQQLAPLLR
jgi:hypothetical protein